MKNDEGRRYSAPANIDYRPHETSTGRAHAQPPRLVVTIELEGKPGYRVECEDVRAHRALLLWLARPKTRERLVSALDDVLERLPGRMERTGRA